jgi:hypothetical protein
MEKSVHTLLLLGLPASGKSELRRYLAHLDPETRRRDLRIGHPALLDELPYVRLMRGVDRALRAEGRDGIFLLSDDGSWIDRRDWGTLIHLLNEDHADMMDHYLVTTLHAGAWVLDRLEAAAQKTGIPPRLNSLPKPEWRKVADALEADATDLLWARNELATVEEDGRTVVIEFARGGPPGATLPPPNGYRYSLAQLSPEILARAIILYVGVSPDESYDQPLVRVEAHGRAWDLPIACFDNRADQTRFLRADPATWPPEAAASLHQTLCAAMQSIG